MPILFLILTVLSLVALLAGIIWTVMAHGQTRRRSGPEVGAEITAERMARDAEADGGAIVSQRTFFEGKAVTVEREASFNLAEIKQGLKEGQWRQMFPVLLAMGGFFGLFLFGMVTAWLAIENKLLAGLIVIAATYALVRMVLAFARA